MLQEHAAIIAEEINDTKRHVAAALKLFDDGATIPFVARYRKEATGSMTETTLRTVWLRHQALTELDKRKQYIIETIKGKGELTPEFKDRILAITDATLLEDLFLPYKPHRRTRAQVAREAGLEPLAKIIMAQQLGGIKMRATCMARKLENVFDGDAAIAGALDIIAEWVCESEKARAIVRAKFLRNGMVSSMEIKRQENDKEGKYQNYYNLSEPVRSINSHRYLAMRRGEAEGVLKVNISIDDDEMGERLCRMFVKADSQPEATALVRQAVVDGYRRLLRPSIETEIANMLKDRSDKAAISLFADNVEQMLMAPPLMRKRVMAIDPGFRTGCKIVCLDAQGNLLAHDVIFPTPPANDFYGSAQTLCYMVDRYQIDVIAIGNGHGSRETERFVTDVELPRKVDVVVVSEQGASIYSASEVAVEEFPDEDVTVRGAVSIGRRLIDPMAELVKIDPCSIGVGQYQHDVNQTKLKEALDFTVSSCVNSVGINLNTASRQLLSYVSGIGPTLAGYIVDYRTEHGPFTNRNQLLEVPRMGAKTYQQCAGFLRIPRGENVLDNTGVHPERYELVEQMASDLGVDVEKLATDRATLHRVELDRYATRAVGLPTLTDIILELEKPGRDPRAKIEDVVVHDDSVRTIADLHLGMTLSGKVNNITGFGVFVDIGIKENGLIHISQLSDKFTTSAAEVVRIGQIVNVKVLDIDIPRGRIALTMKGVPQ